MSGYYEYNRAKARPAINRQAIAAEARAYWYLRRILGGLA